MNDETRVKSVLLILAISIATLGGLMFFAPIAQDPHYHMFADTRSAFGIPNFGDVTSNIGLLLSGLFGIAFMLRPGVRTGGTTFQQKSEWSPYLGFFIGAFLTGVGSAYYHWAPGSERLVWDRLPMTIAFMCMFSAIIAERIHPRAANYLTVPFLILGLGSIANWITTEHLGVGDLRLYAWVQFFPLVCMPVIFWKFPPRYTHTPVLLGALGFYVLAKVFEALDAHVLGLGGLVSGHTIKHILSGLAIFWVLRYLWKRKPIEVSGLVPAQVQKINER